MTTPIYRLSLSSVLSSSFQETPLPTPAKTDLCRKMDPGDQHRRKRHSSPKPKPKQRITERTEASVLQQRPNGSGKIEGGYHVPAYRKDPEDGLTDQMSAMTLTRGRGQSPVRGVGEDFMLFTPTRHRSPEGSAGDHSQNSDHGRGSHQESRPRRIKAAPTGTRQRKQPRSSRANPTARPRRSSGRHPSSDRSLSQSPLGSRSPSPKDRQLQHTQSSRAYPPPSSRSPSPHRGNREIKVYAVSRELSLTPPPKARSSRRSHARKSSHSKYSRSPSPASAYPQGASFTASRPIPIVTSSNPQSLRYFAPSTTYGQSPTQRRSDPPMDSAGYAAQSSPSYLGSNYTGPWVSNGSKSSAFCPIRRGSTDA